MADAWEELIGGSTIEVGDAWDHLLAQGGEGGFINLGLTATSNVDEEILTSNVEYVADTDMTEYTESANSSLTASVDVIVEALTANITTIS